MARPRAKAASKTAKGFSPSRLVRPEALALVVVAGATWLMWAGSRPAPSAGSVAAVVVPDQIGPWAGKPVPVEQRALDILETDDVILKEYRLGEADPPVWFALVAGFGNRAAFHPPELCFVGSHFQILKREPVTVMANGKSRDVMRLVIEQDGTQFESWYWFTANGKITPNYYQQQAWLVLKAIKQEPSSGTLVRISTTIDADPDAARRRLLGFLTSFDASMHPQQVAKHGL